MELTRQEYWSGLPFPSPGDLPNPGIEPWLTALQILYHLSHQGRSRKYVSKHFRNYVFKYSTGKYILLSIGSRKILIAIHFFSWCTQKHSPHVMCDISCSFLTLLRPQLYHNLKTLSLKTLRLSLPTFNDLCSPLVLREHSFCQSVLTSSWPCAFFLLCLQHSSLQFFLLLLWLLCSVDLLGLSLIPWTEEPAGLQSMGLRRVRHD